MIKISRSTYKITFVLNMFQISAMIFFSLSKVEGYCCWMSKVKVTLVSSREKTYFTLGWCQCLFDNQCQSTRQLAIHVHHYVFLLNIKNPLEWARDNQFFNKWAYIVPMHCDTPNSTYCFIPQWAIFSICHYNMAGVAVTMMILTMNEK